MSPHSIAIIGRSGQVAQALARAAAARGVNYSIAGRPDLDLASLDSIAHFLASNRPSVVVNAAAYTAVDRAESEPDLAFDVNTGAPARIATLCAAWDIPLVHLSTDYVFDGTKSTPYVETDPVAPLGVYGASKAAGEAVVRASQPQHIIVRTSWVYSEIGSNFVKTMLRLGAEHETLRVIADQHGAPTSASDLASAILDISERIAARGNSQLWGTYHLTGKGETTWHGFAAEIFRLAAQHGVRTPNLEAIPTSEYPLPARRPANSRLDNSKIEAAFDVRRRAWQTSLADCVTQLAAILRRENLA